MEKTRRIQAEETDWVLEPWEAYQNLETRVPRVLLESARSGPTAGRYSILASDPFLIFRYEKGKVRLTPRKGKARTFRTNDPIEALERLFRKHRMEPDPLLPPFSAGAIGYFSYECKDHLEGRLGSRFRRDLSVPEIYFLFFDRSAVWDHSDRKIFWCTYKAPGLTRPGLDGKEWRGRLLKKTKTSEEAPARKKSSEMKLDLSMDEKTFAAAVKRAQAFIRKGELYQANLSHRISFRMKNDAKAVYARLRKVNPSPFFGILEAEDFSIVSGSPERLLSLKGRILETRPIAGTRARGKDPVQDEALSLDLLLNEKERAEHVMLVDLERNDLGRVCEYGSVRVDELMSVENYSHVKHIVSNIRGVLRSGLNAFDAVKAVFPGGTITGAPKIRSAQIIDELETVPRGPYTGSLGYLSFAGDMDLNILIRSLVIRKGKAWLNVGAGIVADSDPKREYHETLHKAKAVLEAVFGEKSVRRFYERRGVAARVS